MPTLFRRRPTRAVWVLTAWVYLGLCTRTNAEDPAPEPGGTAEPSWLSQSTAALSQGLKSVGTGAGIAWSTITAAVSPSHPVEALPGLLADDDRRFFAVLEAPGLRLSEIRVGGTVISSSSYRFVAAREPSVADLERAERLLEEYRARSSGPRAGAKERIARAVIDLAGDKAFILNAVAIELSPWPSARYEMNARGRPPEGADRRIIGGSRGE